MPDDTDKTRLEALIDSQGIGLALAMLAEICAEKAEHIQSNWQDANLAREWQRAAAKIEKCAHTDIIERLTVR